MNGHTDNTRRSALMSMACGFGHLALTGLLASQPSARGETSRPQPSPHFAPRAKRVIFLFMQGGPSQVDTFDHKPKLSKENGKMMPFDDARTIANTGMRASSQRVLSSPWEFRKHGQTGHWVSSLFPEMAKHVDELCFIHSMQTEGVAHGPATLFLHCGASQFVRPSIGAWINYGLGTDNTNLPGFVSISPSSGNGGQRNFGAAFLPPQFQGTAVGRAGLHASKAQIRNLLHQSSSNRPFELDLLQEFQTSQLAARPGDRELEAIIQSYELAWKMQSHAPDSLDISKESAATRELYGIGSEKTDDFGRQCLMARRLCERGVRFVQVTYGDNTANPAWDQHSNLPKHADHALAVDKPIAGLLSDLKARGLLEDTIVWWGAEFGRTPYAEKNGTGRDHNPKGFTVWLAGGGLKQGFSLGETDDFGHLAVSNPVHMHDLHATLLYLLGLDHEKLTYRHDGRDFRLTDVHGDVIRAILADNRV